VDVSQKKTYTAVKFFKTPSIRIVFSKSKQYISINPLFESLLNNYEISTENIRSDPWIRISIQFEIISTQLYPLILEIYDKALLLSSVEGFSCCSRYVACSDAKSCVHPDKVLATGCSYRQNLLNGKIFYGKNRTI